MPVTKYSKETVWQRTDGNTQEEIIFPRQSQEDMLTVHREPHSLFTDHSVRMAGNSQFPTGYSVRRVDSEDHLVLFSLDGGLQLQGRRPRSLKAGEMLVASAGSEYSYRNVSTCRILWFHFTTPSHWDRLFQNKVEVRQSNYMSEIDMLAQAHRVESDRHHVDSNRFCEGYENLMIGHLERELWKFRTPVEQDQLERIELLWTKVAADPGHDWKIAELARIAGYSESSMHRLTKKLQQATPLDIVRRVRMERAAILLVRAPLTLDTIADEVGYANAFAFSRAFKKHFGVSPTQYRSKFR